jgi:hypothetical protein
LILYNLENTCLKKRHGQILYIESETGIKAALFKHYNLCPKIQIQDIIELIYQNKFIGGYLNENEDGSLRKLQDEYRSLEHFSSNKKISYNVFERIKSLYECKKRFLDCNHIPDSIESFTLLI